MSEVTKTGMWHLRTANGDDEMPDSSGLRSVVAEAAEKCEIPSFASMTEEQREGAAIMLLHFGLIELVAPLEDPWVVGEWLISDDQS